MYRLLFLLLLCSSYLAAALPPGLYQTLKRLHKPPTTYLLVISVADQTLSLYKQGNLNRTYTISTAKSGVGQLEGSEKTPLGLHRIASKYGFGEPVGTIFRGRQNTHEIWKKGKYPGEDLVLTRLLYLEGMEEGYNLGRDEMGRLVDSYERFVYIHGTNHEEDLGRPSSRGCIRMGAEDLIELFEIVPEGSLVWITTSS